MSGKHNLVTALKQWRERTASRLGQPLFKVLNNATIEALAEQQPTTIESLVAIPGLGPKKIAQFGKELLVLLDNQHDLFAAPMAAPETRMAMDDLSVTESKIKPKREEAITTEPAPGQRPEIVFQVSEALDYCNLLLGSAPTMTVEGEFSSLSIHGGHMYATLQDPKDKSLINCFANAFIYQQYRQYCQEGLTVRVTGHPSIYKQKGRFSFSIESVMVAGEGALKQAYELTKQKLADEGLFTRKRELPKLITKVGLITSQTGAVLADFRNNLLERGIELVFYNVRVEGQQAVSQIRRGIATINKQRPDLDCLVLMRGGGSLEDLAPFNDETLVRELFNSRIPTIAAIGHDRDVPLACFAADHYTSTPTAAAMLINQAWLEVDDTIAQQQRKLLARTEQLERWCQTTTSRLTQTLMRGLDSILSHVDRISLGFTRVVASQIDSLSKTEQKASQLGHKLLNSFSQNLTEIEHGLTTTAIKLEQNDPEKPLRLGYTLAFSATGKLITKPETLTPGDHIRVRFARGHLGATITEPYDQQN
jgi:exodeoxyribonuclease VII large subunit